MSVKIAPSILSADFAELGTGVEAIAPPTTSTLT